MATSSLGYLLDRRRSPEDLVRENALLRKQLEVACRQIGRPKLTRTDRGMLVLLARLAPTWHNATLLVQPETLLRWHRAGFRLFWRRTSRRTEAPPRISTETITLIEQMARKNRLWGAERIRGELLKLGIRVALILSRALFALAGQQSSRTRTFAFVPPVATELAAEVEEHVGPLPPAPAHQR